MEDLAYLSAIPSQNCVSLLVGWVDSNTIVILPVLNDAFDADISIQEYNKTGKIRTIDIQKCIMNMDWNQARAFCATAECGSLSAAAKQLGLTQPTLSRQVAALELALGVSLFERVGKKLRLTESGKKLLHSAQLMNSAANSLMLAASGQSNLVEGVVSISVTDGMAANLLPPIIERLRMEAPGIKIELIVSNTISDLLRREADIAIRHVRPEEPELIGKLIREPEAHFYASESWVRKNGNPQAPQEAKTCDFIGFDREGRYIEHLHGLGFDVEESNFPIICSNSLVATELAVRGLGINVMMREVAENIPGLVRVFEKLPPITFPIWLVTHRELRTSKRIRIVYDALTEGLKI